MMISKNDEQVLKALSESFNTNLLQKKSIMESLEQRSARWLLQKSCGFENQRVSQYFF
jgi:hypothetical protein